MKYNDNGEYKYIYVKTFDTLPVGAIVEYTGTTIPSGWTNIGNNRIQKTSQYIEGGAGLPSYFTNEIKTGEFWIDNKPIYKKTIVYTNSQTIGTTGRMETIDIPHNISNFSQVIKPPEAVSNTGNIFPILNAPTTTSNVQSSASIAFVNSTNIQMRLINLTLSSRTFYITLEYTKTTD